MSCRFLLVSLVLAAGCASANPYERTLANGLRVIIKEDNRAPTVSHLVWYRVGSMDETNGVTGVAHVLERMMLKGTRTAPPGDFSRRVAERRLVRERRIANEAGASYETYARGPGVLVLDGVPAEGRTMAELESALRAELTSIANDEVTAIVRAERIVVPHPAQQAHVRIGVPALARTDPDYVPPLVGNYVLGGGGFVSRLTRDVRGERGYACSVYGYFLPLARPGPFQIGLQTRRDQADAAIARVRAVVGEFLALGPTDGEFADAKASLVGGFPLRIDSNRKLLNEWATVGFYRLPERWLADFPREVERVTAAGIRAAFARHVQPERFVTVVVGADEGK